MNGCSLDEYVNSVQYLYTIMILMFTDVPTWKDVYLSLKSSLFTPIYLQ